MASYDHSDALWSRHTGIFSSERDQKFRPQQFKHVCGRYCRYQPHGAFTVRSEYGSVATHRAQLRMVQNNRQSGPNGASKRRSAVDNGATWRPLFWPPTNPKGCCCWEEEWVCKYQASPPRAFPSVQPKICGLYFCRKGKIQFRQFWFWVNSPFNYEVVYLWFIVNFFFWPLRYQNISHHPTLDLPNQLVKINSWGLL